MAIQIELIFLGLLDDCFQSIWSIELPFCIFASVLFTECILLKSKRGKVVEDSTYIKNAPVEWGLPSRL